jgi:hypothetical protein
MAKARIGGRMSRIRYGNGNSRRDKCSKQGKTDGCKLRRRLLLCCHGGGLVVSFRGRHGNMNAAIRSLLVVSEMFMADGGRRRYLL